MSSDTEGREALVHLQIPAATKARWVHQSQSQGRTLTDWICGKIDGAPAQNLTPASYEALAVLAGLTSLRSIQAGYLVMVDGMSSSAAADSASISRQQCSNTLKSLRDTLELVRRVDATGKTVENPKPQS